MSWKKTLFVWRGMLTEKQSEDIMKLNWTGTWVGTQDVVHKFPSAEEFQEASTTFELSVVGNFDMNCFKIVPSEAASLAPRSNMECTWIGSYLLDNGSGLETFRDLQHKCMLSEDPAGTSAWIVSARGTTEFGPFLSKGRLENVLGVWVLTLARRYVSDSDTRLTISLEAAHDELLNDHAQLLRPWEAIPYQVRPNPKKRPLTKRSRASDGETRTKREKHSRQ
jgi:hypothetical protein